MSWFERPAEEYISTNHVQLFLPSVDREGSPIPHGQRFWVRECLEVMGKYFGGATAFPPGLGVWRDDEAEGALVYDETVIVFSYVRTDDLTGEAGEALLGFLRRLGREGRQGEVGIYVDDEYIRIVDFEEEEE